MRYLSLLANPLIKQFTHCSVQPNPYTSHIRLPNTLYNISLTPPPQPENSKRDEYQASPQNDAPRFFNPAIIPLPYWSHPAKYVLVTRVVTFGFHQESHICLADICLPESSSSHLPTKDRTRSEARQALPPDTRPCTALDHAHLGPNGGLRCITPPLKINIPPTPAEKCEDAWLAFPDIPGFHDPRVFWSGKGEPLILVNSASRYECVGLWIVDLRRVYPDVERVLSREARGNIFGTKRDIGDEQDENEQTGLKMGTQRGLGLKPSMSYPHLTELTRNPRASRSSVEKNWMLWFPNGDEAYVQYDLLGHRMIENKVSSELQAEPDEGLARLGQAVNLTQAYVNTTLDTNRTYPHNSTQYLQAKRRLGSEPKGGRTFAKLTGKGFTTQNFTHPAEQPCFLEGHFRDSLGNMGHWHQGSNSLRLILCTRAQARNDPACRDEEHDEGHGRNGSKNVGAVESGRSLHFCDYASEI